MIMAQVARAQAVIDLIVNDKGVAEQIKRTFEDAERKVTANGEVFQLKVDDSDFIDKFKKIKEISGDGNKIIIDFDDTSFKNAFGSASKEVQNSMAILKDFIVDIIKVFNGNGGLSNNFGEVRKLYDKIIKEEDKLAKIDRDNLKESFKNYKKNGSEENRNKFMAAYEEYSENTPSNDRNFKFTYNKKKYSFDDLKKEYNSLDDLFASLNGSGDVLDSIIDPIRESFRTAKKELENEIADLKNQAKNIINPVKGTEENKADDNGNGDYSNINITPANLDEFYEKIEQHGTAKIAIKPANLEEFYDDIDEYQSKNGSAISKKDKSIYKDVVKLMKDYKDLSPEDLINEQRKLLNEAMKGTDTPLSNDQVKQLVALRELYKKKGVDSNAFKPSKYLLNAGRDDFDNIMPGYSDIKESFENTAKKYLNAGTIPVKVTPLNLNSFFDKLKTEADKEEIGINVTVDNVNTSNVSSNIAENTRELQEQENLLKKISSLDDIIEKGDINVLDNFDENGKLISKYIDEKDLTSSKKTVTKKSIDKLIKDFNPEKSSEEDMKKIASYLSAYKNPDNLKDSSFKDNRGLWQRVNLIIDNAKNSLNAYAEKEKLLKEHSEELNNIIEDNKKQNTNNGNNINKQKPTPVIEQDESPIPKEIEEPIEKSVLFKTSFDETSIESLKGSAKTLKQDIESLVSPVEVSFKESSVNNLASVISEELSKLKIPSGSKNAKEEDFKEENNKTKKEKTFEEKFFEEHRQGDLNYLRNVFSDVFGISPSSRNQRVVDKISLKREDNIYPISRKREAAMLPQPLEAYIQEKYGYTDSERKKVLNNTGKGYTPKYGLVEDLLNTYKKEKGNLSNVKSNGNNNYRSDADMLKAALASAVEYYPNKDNLKKKLFKNDSDLFDELNLIVEQSSTFAKEIYDFISTFRSFTGIKNLGEIRISDADILNKFEDSIQKNKDFSPYDHILNILNDKDLLGVSDKRYLNFDYEEYEKERDVKSEKVKHPNKKLITSKKDNLLDESEYLKKKKALDLIIDSVNKIHADGIDVNAKYGSLKKSDYESGIPNIINEDTTQEKWFTKKGLPKKEYIEELLNDYKIKNENFEKIKLAVGESSDEVYKDSLYRSKSSAGKAKRKLAAAVDSYQYKDSLKNTLFKDDQDLFDELNKIVEQSSMILGAKQDIIKGLSEFNSSNNPSVNARSFTSEGKIPNIYDYIQSCFLNSEDEVLKKSFSNFDFERYKRESDGSDKQKPKTEPKKTEEIKTGLPDNNTDLISGLKDIETTISNVVSGIRNITQEYNTSVSSIQGGIDEQKKSIESIGDSVEKALKSIEPLNKGMEETASAYKKTIEEANQISEGLEKRIKAFEEYKKEKEKLEKDIQKSEEESNKKAEEKSNKKEGKTSNKISKKKNKNPKEEESYYDKTVKKIKDGFDKTTFAKDSTYVLDENSFEEMANGTVKFVAELKLANDEVERLVFNVGEADSILTKNGSVRKDFLKNNGVLENPPEISFVSEQEENKIKETSVEIDGLENKVEELKKIASNTSGFNIIDEDKLKEDEDGFIRFSAAVADTKGKLKELYFEVQDLTYIAKQDGGFTTTFKNSGITKETIEKNKAKSDKKNLEVSQQEALEQLKNASINSDFFNLKSSKFDNSGFLTFIGYLEDADGKVKELSYSAKELNNVLNQDGTLNKTFIEEGNITKLEEILEKFKVQLAKNKTNEALGIEDEEGIKNASRLETEFKTNVDSANLSLEKQQELLLKLSQIKANPTEKFDLEDKKNSSARNKANKATSGYENTLDKIGYTGNEETNYENLNKDLHIYDKVEGKVVTLKEKMDALKNSADALFDSINGGKFADKGAFENAVRELQQKSSEMEKIANNQAYQNVNNKGESYDGKLFDNENLKLLPVEEIKKAIKKKYEKQYEFLDDINYDPTNGTAKAIVKNNGNVEKMTVSLTSLRTEAGKTEVAIHRLNVVQGEYLTTGQKWKNAIKGKITSLIQYVSGLSLVMGAVNKFREGFSFIREFDASLTTINQTMDVSSSQLQKLGSSSISLGKQLGSTAQDVLGAVSIYANANETADSILEKAQPTIMLSNASGGDVSESSDQIQAVTQQFDELEGQERRIVNSYEKISSNIAMDFQKGIGVIAEGTQNAGSVAKESGMQFEQFASSVAKVAEKTRQDGM